jgi:hypothetical protein
MAELIVHFQCDSSKKMRPVSPEIERPSKSWAGVPMRSVGETAVLREFQSLHVGQ